ncbi:MAG: hypothetical protein HOP13_01145 [Alphaproteobacteria bacterium]|nr:hypothetical protein [Alphaproteobacteria bacterium]
MDKAGWRVCSVAVFESPAGIAGLDDSLRHLEAALSELPNQRELIPTFVSAAMAIAAPDKGERLTALLQGHENAIAVEPLSVALLMLRGEKPLVAKEVSDVAWDIVVRASNKLGQEEQASALVK